jgi:hypothetical protein
MPHSYPSQHDNFPGLISILTQMFSGLCIMKACFSSETGTLTLFIMVMYWRSYRGTGLSGRIFIINSQFNSYVIFSFLQSVIMHIHEVIVRTCCSMQCVNTESLTETKIRISVPSTWFTQATPNTKMKT